MELTQVDTTDTANTSTVTLSKRGRCWILTWNNHSVDDLSFLTQHCTSECKDYAFQEEKGEQGTPHIQIYLEYKNARTFSSVKKVFPKCHIELCRNKFACAVYCQKVATRNGVSIAKDNTPPKDPLDGKILYEYQREIIDLMQEVPDDRTIHWYYDRNGGIGKTSLAKSLCIKYPNEVLYLSGKASDIKFGVAQFTKTTKLKMAIFDFTRTSEGYISYEAIEAIKNGIFYNCKYESSMVVFDCPHIVVLSNFPPDREKLSKDRWCIKNVTNLDIKTDLVREKKMLVPEEDEDNIEDFEPLNI